MGESVWDKVILKAQLRSLDLIGGDYAYLPMKGVERPDGSFGKDIYVPASACIPQEEIAAFEVETVASDMRVVQLSDDEFRQAVGDPSELPA